jgi:hypothetical protein
VQAAAKNERSGEAVMAFGSSRRRPSADTGKMRVTGMTRMGRNILDWTVVQAPWLDSSQFCTMRTCTLDNDAETQGQHSQGNRSGGAWPSHWSHGCDQLIPSGGDEVVKRQELIKLGIGVFINSRPHGLTPR